MHIHDKTIKAIKFVGREETSNRCPTREEESNGGLPAFDLREQLEFVHDGLNAFFGHDPSLAHLLHSVYFALDSLALNAPNLSKTSSPNRVVKVKVSLCYR